MRSAVYSFAPHLQVAVVAIPYLCIVKPNNPTPVRRRLTLTHVGLGKDTPDGTELTSAIKVQSRKCFLVTPCFIRDPHIVLG